MPSGKSVSVRDRGSGLRSRRREPDDPSGARQRFFTFRTIGSVQTTSSSNDPAETIPEESTLVIRPELSGGLDGVEPGDRLMVVFVFDRAGDFELLQHPRGDRRRALRGVFALHSPRRPNPIGVTIVDVVEIAENLVRVRGLDAWPDTPILDLKRVPREE